MTIGFICVISLSLMCLKTLIFTIHSFVDGDIDVQLSSEITGALRSLKVQDSMLD